MSRMCQVAGQSAATVIRLSGGMTDLSGRASSMPSKPQKDGGKRGQTMSTFRFEPKGANESAGLSFDGIHEGWE